MLDISLSLPFSDNGDWFFYLGVGTGWKKYGPYVSVENAKRAKEIIIAHLSEGGCHVCYSSS